MASQKGYRDWTEFRVKEQAWLSGRLIGTGDTLLNNIPEEIPPIGGGVPVGAGFYDQSTLASPKAPIGATAHSSWSWTFDPQLDEDSARHVLRVINGQAFGAAKLWHPWGTGDQWNIPSTARTQWSLPHPISGGPVVTATALRGIFVEPIVEIVEKDPAGLLESTLTRVPSSPSSTEYAIVTTTDDQESIETGDLTGKVGKILSIWYWPILRVVITGATQGFALPGRWPQSFEFTKAPPPKAYEADA